MKWCLSLSYGQSPVPLLVSCSPVGDLVGSLFPCWSLWSPVFTLVSLFPCWSPMVPCFHLGFPFPLLVLLVPCSPVGDLVGLLFPNWSFVCPSCWSLLLVPLFCCWSLVDPLLWPQACCCTGSLAHCFACLLLALVQGLHVETHMIPHRRGFVPPVRRNQEDEPSDGDR